MVWGVVWGTFGTAVATVMRLIDKIPFGYAVLDGIGMGIRIGVMGGIAAAAFFAFISVAYRGKRLADISWVRFGIGGAIVAGLFVPGFLQTMNLLTGGPLVPWHLLFDDLVLSAVFGGITAGGTMLLAQRNEAAHPVTVEDLLNRMEQESLGAGEPTGYRKSERTRSVERR
jgi:MFS family permease